MVCKCKNDEAPSYLACLFFFKESKIMEWPDENSKFTKNFKQFKSGIKNPKRNILFRPIKNF